MERYSADEARESHCVFGVNLYFRLDADYVGRVVDAWTVLW